ncbi:phosphohydrolase [Roseateles paludis]|jgi:phosphonate degradation associated HDIG domain protein|uniref:Phosphohydrolase n=1 Tax=Roseateles paludis TaxID=3145238 RepID=A0ABV0FYY4_9BURK
MLHDTIARIEQLFMDHGEQPYEGARRESVSATAHALQCAQLAEWAHADHHQVAAAFLHDIGHFLAAEAVARDDHLDDAHEALALPLLARCFGPAVTEPIRLHVQAKRYLVSVDAAYFLGLSPASVHSLQLQGGPMSKAESQAFERLPFAREAVQLRRWDDLAKVPGHATPPLDYYLALLQDLATEASSSEGAPLAAA